MLSYVQMTTFYKVSFYEVGLRAKGSLKCVEHFFSWKYYTSIKKIMQQVFTEQRDINVAEQSLEHCESVHT